MQRNRIWRFLYLFICGVLVGGGAILPGISGGVLCVVFGIYQPMMELISRPVKTFRKYYAMFLPVIAGWLIGFWGFARLIEVMFRISEVYTTWLFIGLILGTLPSLLREAGKHGRSRRSLYGFAAAFCLMAGLLVIAASDMLPAVTADPLWYLFCGVLWGLSVVVPGMTSSSILMSLDLYESLNAGIAGLDMAVILPWLLGLLLIVAALAKVVTRLFETHYSLFYHCVLGIVAASTLVIIPTEYANGRQFLISILIGIFGAAAAWLFSLRGPDVREEET